VSVTITVARASWRLAGLERSCCAWSGIACSARPAAGDLLRIDPLDLSGELARNLRQLGEGSRDGARRGHGHGMWIKEDAR